MGWVPGEAQPDGAGRTSSLRHGVVLAPHFADLRDRDPPTCGRICTSAKMSCVWGGYFGTESWSRDIVSITRFLKYPIANLSVPSLKQHVQ